MIVAAARSAFAALLSTLLLMPPAHAHVRGCHTRDCDKRIHKRRIRRWIRTHVWIYRWHHLSGSERRWARCIAGYETRGIPWAHKAQTATGNGYLGSTQWLLSTALAAGFHPRPKDHPGPATVTSTSLDEQLVRTILWARKTGSSQWSTSRYCGSVS